MRPRVRPAACAYAMQSVEKLQKGAQIYFYEGLVLRLHSRRCFFDEMMCSCHVLLQMHADESFGLEL